MEETQKIEYRKFFKEVVFVAIAQWFPRLKAFIILPFIIKLLGVEMYGIWSQLLVTISLIYPFSILGLTTSLRRFLPGKEKKEAKNDFWAAVFLIIFNGFILALGLYLFSPYLVGLFFKTTEALFLLKLAVILIPLTAINQVFLESFVTFSQSKKYALFASGREIIEAGLMIYFLLNGQGLFALLAVSIGTIALSIVLAALIFIKQLGTTWPKFSALKPYFQIGLPLFFSGFAYWLFYSSDRYIIGHFLNIQSVGIYSGIYNLSYIIIAVAGPIYFVLLPVISKFWEENKVEEVKNYLKYSLKYFLIISIPVIFGLSVLGKQVLAILTTHEFLSWWYLIPIIGSGLIIYMSFSLGEYILILAKKTSIILKYTIFAALFSISLNILFVPKYGIISAAITSFLTYLFYGIAIFFASRKYLIFTLDLSSLTKIIFASILMSLPLFIFQPEGIKNILFFLPISIFIYGLTLIVSGGLSMREINIILRNR